MMFGLSREERRRLEKVEETADEARDKGITALAEIAKHAGECNVRQQNRVTWEGEVKDMLKWLVRGMISVLIAALGAVLLEVARRKGLF
jgi:hypothetical protein